LDYAILINKGCLANVTYILKSIIREYRVLVSLPDFKIIA
jgi:hypothetical protein